MFQKHEGICEQGQVHRAEKLVFRVVAVDDGIQVGIGLVMDICLDEISVFGTIVFYTFNCTCAPFVVSTGEIDDYTRDLPFGTGLFRTPQLNLSMKYMSYMSDRVMSNI